MINSVVIFGAGYVGMSLSALISQTKKVCLIDTDKDKLLKVSQGISPIQDTLIEDYLTSKELMLETASTIHKPLESADLAILCLPTNFDHKTNRFDTSILEETISNILEIKNVPILIKSTIPIGFTDSMINKHPNAKILFSPEFLREGNSLYDNLNPSRIIIGGDFKIGELILDMFKDLSLNNPPAVLMSTKEAESVKLFSNSYLALRVSFFNELDNFCLEKNIDPKKIIEGLSFDQRIGDGYNNPSFGYGGYCLPKDSMQLKTQFDGIPQNIISSIIQSNRTRKEFIASKILKSRPKTLGIFRLAMKYGSDNYRESAVLDIIDLCKDQVNEIIIYEPQLSHFRDFKIVNSLATFKKDCDLIVANRMEADLEDIKDKVFTRDIFMEN